MATVLKMPTPDKMMEEARELQAKAREIEGQAIRAALGLTAGNVRQACVLLGVSSGFLSRVVLKGRRHADLRGLINRKRGRPPESPEAVSKRAQKLPPELAGLMPKGGKKVKPNKTPSVKRAKSPKAIEAPKVEEKVTKKTEAEWTSILAAWKDAKAAGENQKAFAERMGVGVSTLRERAKAERDDVATAAIEAVGSPS